MDADGMNGVNYLGTNSRVMFERTYPADFKAGMATTSTSAGFNDATVQITDSMGNPGGAEGGTPPYKYHWSSNVVWGGTPPTENDYISTNLWDGIYQVRVEDANGFFYPDPTQYPIGDVWSGVTYLTGTVPPQNYPFYAVFTITHTLSGQSTGQIQVTTYPSLAPDAPPYTYIWTKGGLPYGGNTSSLNGLGVGTYTCRVTNANSSIFFAYGSTTNVPPWEFQARVLEIWFTQNNNI